MTLDLPAAAALLGIHRDTLRERAAAGIIPGAKIGKSWRFLEADLVAYIRSQYRCRSTAAPVAQWIEQPPPKPLLMLRFTGETHIVHTPIPGHTRGTAATVGTLLGTRRHDGAHIQQRL